MNRAVILLSSSGIRAVALAAAASISVVNCDAPPAKKRNQVPISPRHDTVLKVAQRLKVGLAEGNLRISETTKDGVKILYPKGGKFDGNGLMISRVATSQIRSNINEVAGMWLNQNLRKEWDTTTSSAQVLKQNEDGSILCERVEKPVALLVPSRDYVYEIHRSGGGVVGINNYTTIAFVNIDSGDEAPKSWLAVRGVENSLLILEPRGDQITEATLCIERDPGGWAWMSPLIANFVAGNNPAKLLAQMKKALENEEDSIPAGLSVEEEARLKFKRRQLKLEKQKQGLTIVDDLYAKEEDLKATVALLEERLKRLKQTEAAEKINLSELKARVESDLKKAKEHLRSLKH